MIWHAGSTEQPLGFVSYRRGDLQAIISPGARLGSMPPCLDLHLHGARRKAAGRQTVRVRPPRSRCSDIPPIGLAGNGTEYVQR
jgi:hypothetical protein